MPVNRNALLRYTTIDRCLRNRRRRWTLEDLIEAVSEALYDAEGIDKGISRRSVQADLQVMRSDRLGYNAPIVVTERKYYNYADADYTITRIPLGAQDLQRMNEAVAVLRQFKGFSHFGELRAVVQKLEAHVYAASAGSRSVIEFDRNEGLRGLEHLDALYNAIIAEQCLRITYQSFTARAAGAFHFHAWWLKEYRNRWFVVGIKGKGQPPLSLALDRIQALEPVQQPAYLGNGQYEPAQYYRHVVGVSVSENLRPERVRLFINKLNAPYVETKPLHPSQEVTARSAEGIEVQLLVQLNFELERELLGFGPGLEVLAPARLRRRISTLLAEAAGRYATPWGAAGC